MSEPEVGDEADDGDDPHPHGNGYVCFDATPLFKFREVGRLDLLKEWFPMAFTADVIMEEEIGSQKVLARYPENRQILEAGVVRAVQVTDAAGLQLVVDLRSDWDSDENKDRGEAEVLALCRRYGWTAITNDKFAIAAGGRPGIKVPCVHTLDLVIAAAAHELIAPKDAWRLHTGIHGSQSDAALSSSNSHRPIFMSCIGAFKKLRSQDWPHLLCHHQIPNLVPYAIKHSR